MSVQAAVRLGSLKAEAEQYQRNQQERDKFVRETAARLGIHLPSPSASAAAAGVEAPRPGVYTPLSSRVLEGFKADLMSRRAQVQQELEAARLRFKGEDDALNQQLDAAHAELSRNSEKAKMSREQQVVLRSKIDGAQIQVRGGGWRDGWVGGGVGGLNASADTGGVCVAGGGKLRSW